MDQIEAMIESCDDRKSLVGMLKNPLFSGYKPKIEARVAVLTAKPAWKPKYQISDKGRFILPAAVALDGVAALREALDRYEQDPKARNFADG